MNVTVEASIRMECPVEAVTAILLDADSAPLWTTDLERMEVVRGTPGGAGSKARMHYIQQGRRYVMEDELLEVVPNRYFKSHVSGEALSAIVETSLTPIGEATQVSIRWTGTGGPLVMRLLLPLLRRSIKRQALADLRKLKDLAERRHAAGSDLSAGR
jgi:hypothetical protein